MLLHHDEPALQQFARVLAIREKSLPPNHIDIASVLINIADIHNKRGEPTLALPLHRRALAIAEQARGPDDAEVGRALSGLGTGLLLRGDAAGAIAPLERAFALRGSTAGDPVARCRVRLRLGDALWRTGRDRARARELVREADDVCAEASLRGEEPRQQIAAWLAEHPASAIGDRSSLR